MFEKPPAFTNFSQLRRKTFAENSFKMNELKHFLFVFAFKLAIYLYEY